MPDLEGVPSDSPTDQQDPEQVQDSAPPAVNDGVTPDPQDRPVENAVGEFNRKFSTLQQQMNDLMAIIAASPVANRAQPDPKPDYTDEQLVELSRAGSVEAQLKLQERLTERKLAQHTAAMTQAQVVQAQLQAVYVKYPQLSDSSDPLTVEAMKAKAVLLRSGQPNNPATDLDAIKLAVLDNPHLVKKAGPATQDFNRRGAVQTQQTMDGASPRKSQPSNQPKRKIDPRALEIAKRMGVPDAEAAIARWEERNKKGRNSVSPTVAMILREES